MNEFTPVLAESLRRGDRLVLATVAAVRGSAPRETGARMLVGETQTRGTVGGGTLEHRCVAEARSMLAGGLPLSLLRFDPDSGVDQACGGRVDVLFERLESSDSERAETLSRMHAAGPLVRVVAVGGAAAGRWLLVSADQTSGSLGNPAIDVAARDASRALLAKAYPRSTTELRTVATAGEPAMLLFDPLHEPSFDIFLFGAGHVGRALVDVLGRIDCSITWIDSRRDVFPGALPANVRTVHAEDPEREVDRAPEGAFVLVMTHVHDSDFAISERALAREDLAYVGMIGSLPKRDRLVQRLQQRDDPASRGALSRIDRLVCPIGITGIRGKEPATIAIAVAAQLLQIRDARAAGRRFDAASAAVGVQPGRSGLAE